MLFVPIPNTGNDFFQAVMHWIPSQHTLCFFTGCHQSGWVAGTAWRFSFRNCMPRNLSCGFNDFSNGIPDTIAQIKEIAFTALHQILHSKDMCLCQIGHVNVIPNTSAVRSIIICPVYGNGISLTVWHLQNQWNQMAFRIVCFPNRTACICAAGVEVPQRNISQTAGFCSPVEHFSMASLVSP